jgi:outer membrane lipoprotein SlyB
MIRFQSMAILAVGFVSLLGLTACSPSAPSGSVYKSSEALKPQEVKFAQLLSVRPVQIETSSSTAAGTMAGGAIGGVAGSQMGSGRGTEAVLGGLIGATVGAIAGSAAERAANKSAALEMTIRMEDSGRVVSVVQASDEQFVVGERVRVLIQSGKYRIAP